MRTSQIVLAVMFMASIAAVRTASAMDEGTTCQAKNPDGWEVFCGGLEKEAWCVAQKEKTDTSRTIRLRLIYGKMASMRPGADSDEHMNFNDMKLIAGMEVDAGEYNSLVQDIYFANTNGDKVAFPRESLQDEYPLPEHQRSGFITLHSSAPNEPWRGHAVPRSVKTDESQSSIEREFNIFGDMRKASRLAIMIEKESSPEIFDLKGSNQAAADLARCFWTKFSSAR